MRTLGITTILCFVVAIVSYSQTRTVAPRATGEGSLGAADAKWADAHVNTGNFDRIVLSGEALDSWSEKEDALGNPLVDDYVLSSKVDGTRSWVENAGGGGGTFTNLFQGAGTTGSVWSTSADTNKYLRGDGTWQDVLTEAAADLLYLSITNNFLQASTITNMLDAKVGTNDTVYLAALTNAVYAAQDGPTISGRVLNIGTNLFAGGGGTAYDDTKIWNYTMYQQFQLTFLADAYPHTPVLGTIQHLYPVTGTNGIDGAATDAPFIGGEYWSNVEAIGVSATGGTVTNYTSGGTNWTAHIYTTVGTNSFTVSRGGSFDVLVVAGGGGGGTCGGGAAGGMVYTNGTLAVETYSVIVGDGGAGSPAGVAGDGVSGNDSVFGSYTAIGGGYGGGRSTGTEGGDGGSGGGASRRSTLFGSGTAGQGNDGGRGSANVDGRSTGGGGGGAGAVGGNTSGSSDVNAGVGGAGLSSTITGATNFYGGGGGGAGLLGTNPGSGGIGGGGDGYTSGTRSGGENTGGGGGAGGSTASDSFGAALEGGKGGSGIVVIRYVTGSTTISESSVISESVDMTAAYDRVLVTALRSYDTDYDTPVLNTDFKISVGETTNAWSQIMLSDVGIYDVGGEGSYIISQGSIDKAGTNFVYKANLLNTNCLHRLYGVMFAFP